MSELRRLLPEGFLDAYTEAFGGAPPAEFLEVYELLCDSFYFGSLPREPGENHAKGKQYRTGFDFGDPRLFRVKDKADRRLAAIRAAVRTWTAARARQGARRPRPTDHRRGDLAGAGGAGRPRPDTQGPEGT